MDAAQSQQRAHRPRRARELSLQFPHRRREQGHRERRQRLRRRDAPNDYRVDATPTVALGSRTRWTITTKQVTAATVTRFLKPVTYRRLGAAARHGTVSQSSRAERYPQALCATSESPQAGSGPSTGAECRRSIAATSLGVASRMEGHPNAFNKQTNCFSSPSARGTWSLLDRRKPPRKCRLKECSPGETWYTLICLGEIAPTFEPSRKTLTTPPSPIAGLRRWARSRPSRDAARTTTRVGNAGQIRLGARHNWMVAPTSSSMPSKVSPFLVAATTSDLSRSWFIVLSYTDRRKKNSNKLMKFRLNMLGRRGDHLRTPLNNPHRRARGCPLPPLDTAIRHMRDTGKCYIERAFRDTRRPCEQSRGGCSPASARFGFGGGRRNFRVAVQRPRSTCRSARLRSPRSGGGLLP